MTYDALRQALAKYARIVVLDGNALILGINVTAELLSRNARWKPSAKGGVQNLCSGDVEGTPPRNRLPQALKSTRAAGG